MTGRATAAATRDAVAGKGGSFMMSREAKEAGSAGGYHGWEL